MENLVESGEFYSISNDSLESYSLLKGTTVLVVGEGFFPASQEDPYLFRKCFAVLPLVNGTLDLEGKPYVVNAVNLSDDLGGELKASLKAMLEVLAEAPDAVPN